MYESNKEISFNNFFSTYSKVWIRNENPPDVGSGIKSSRIRNTGDESVL
jgi:hypothetical protein